MRRAKLAGSAMSRSGEVEHVLERVVDRAARNECPTGARSTAGQQAGKDAALAGHQHVDQRYRAIAIPYPQAVCLVQRLVMAPNNLQHQMLTAVLPAGATQDTTPPGWNSRPRSRDHTPCRRADTPCRGDRHAGVHAAPQVARATYLVSRNSLMPTEPPSRPSPECLTPPKGAAGLDTRPLLSPTMPHSSRSQTRRARRRSSV